MFDPTPSRLDSASRQLIVRYVESLNSQEKHKLLQLSQSTGDIDSAVMLLAYRRLEADHSSPRRAALWKKIEEVLFSDLR
jgi:hypothetical protein